jgi:lysophospholipase L1-like esterase
MARAETSAMAIRHYAIFSIVFWVILVLAEVTSPWAALGQIDLTEYNSARPLKIMAIGDSITDDCSYNGAWRQFLQPLLQSNGYAFTFVGRQASTVTSGFTETHHEGYCGAVIAPPGVLTDPVHGYSGANVYLLKIVADALTNIRPDVVLVVMGANDIGRGRDPVHVATNDIPHLLELIWSNAPDANIILTKTTTLSNAVFGYATNASNVPIYDASLEALVNQKAGLGQKLSLADMFSVVDYATMFNSDHLHPNLLGLKAMANEFLTRIRLITTQFNPALRTLIPAGAIWKYSDAGQDLGTNWVQPDYDDSSWSMGPARLGYGDQTVATTISFGPDFIHKIPTSYFRYSFVVPPEVAFTNLNVRLSRQDGAVVWLNGRELFRTNMPTGAITYTNRALKRVNGDAGFTFYPTNLAVSALPAGTNIVAVELHINSPVIPSLGFDMELLASGYRVPPPALSISLDGDRMLLSWMDDGRSSYALYTSNDLVDPATWTPQAGSILNNENQHMIEILPDSNRRFFRLQRQ